MTITLLSRWLALLALLASLPFSRGCDCGGTAATPQTTETPQHSDVSFVLVYSQPFKASTGGGVDRTARALISEFTSLHATLGETGQFQLWAPQTKAAKVKERAKVLAAENAKLAAEGPQLLMTYPLGSLDAKETAIDLKQQFPEVKFDIAPRDERVYVLASGAKQTAIEARLDWLIKQESRGTPSRPDR